MHVIHPPPSLPKEKKGGGEDGWEYSKYFLLRLRVCACFNYICFSCLPGIAPQYVWSSSFTPALQVDSRSFWSVSGTHIFVTPFNNNNNNNNNNDNNMLSFSTVNDPEVMLALLALNSFHLQQLPFPSPYPNWSRLSTGAPLWGTNLYKARTLCQLSEKFDDFFLSFFFFFFYLGHKDLYSVTYVCQGSNRLMEGKRPTFFTLSRRK